MLARTGCAGTCPKKLAYALTRWRNTVWQQFFYGLSRVAPSILRRSLLKKGEIRGW
jgi:hypothetical protein